MSQRVAPGLLITCLRILLVVAALAGWGATANADQVDRGDVLVAGGVSHNFKKHLKDIAPFNDYLTTRPSGVGITRGEVNLSSSMDEVITQFRAREIDWATETAFGVPAAVEAGVAEAMALRWKMGKRAYKSLLFVREDQPIHKLADLRGKIVAFEDAGSTSGFVIPAATLRQQGLTLHELGTPREEPRPDAVNYVFAREEINISTWVYRGLVQAGALNDGNWLEAKHMPPQFRAKMHVLYESQTIPRSFVLVRKTLGKPLKRQLLEILLAMHGDKDPHKPMKHYQKTSRLEAADDDVHTARKHVGSLRKFVFAE